MGVELQEKPQKAAFERKKAGLLGATPAHRFAIFSLRRKWRGTAQVVQAERQLHFGNYQAESVCLTKESL